MKKSAIAFVFLFIVQSIQPQIQFIPAKSGQPSEWLAWFKSLRTPTKEDVRKAKAYVTGKWRCLRYGENCSAKERTILASLVIVLSGFITIRNIRKYRETKNRQWESSKEKQLIEATEKSDKATVKKLLDAGANPNAVDRFNLTALMYAFHKSDIVKLLLANENFDINAHYQGAKTLKFILKIEPLSEWKSAIEVVKILAPYFDDIKDRDGRTGIDILNDGIKTNAITQKEYNQFIRYARSKKEFMAAITPPGKTPLYTLPLEVRGKIFEYVKERPLSEKQREEIMKRSKEEK